MAFPRDSTPITEAMILRAIQDEEELEQTSTSEDYSHYKPTVPNLAKLIRLSFYNIQEISNLTGLTNVVDLRLDNNRISKIENLAHMRHLQKLDLSFNIISTIEGLGTLTELTDLVLHGNRIRLISDDLLKLPKLDYLSLGCNEVSDMSELLKLRHSRKLRALVLDGSPISEKEDYRAYAVAFIKSLKFLDFVGVSDEERDAAREGGVPLEELKAIEAPDQEAEELRQRHASNKKLLDELRCQALHASVTLMDDVFEAGTEFSAFLKLPSIRQAKEAMQEAFMRCSQEFVSVGRVKAAAIEQEIQQANRAADIVLSEADAVSLEALRSYRLSQKSVFRQVLSKAEEMALDHARDSLTGFIGSPDLSPQPLEMIVEQQLHPAAESLRKQLELVEVDTNGKLRAIHDAFDGAIGELMQSKLHEHEQFFRAFETADKHYLDASEQVLRGLQEYLHPSGTDGAAPHPEGPAASGAGSSLDSLPDGVTEDDVLAADDLPDEAREVLESGERLGEALKAHVDAHVSRINEAEDESMSMEKERCAAASSNFRQEETSRHRERLHEIHDLEEHCIRAAQEHVSRSLERGAYRAERAYADAGEALRTVGHANG